jgi:hypothetical protein
VSVSTVRKTLYNVGFYSRIQSCYFGHLSGKSHPKDVRRTRLDIRLFATAIRQRMAILSGGRLWRTTILTAGCLLQPIVGMRATSGWNGRPPGGVADGMPSTGRS